MSACTCEYTNPPRWGYAGETPQDPERWDDPDCPIHGEFARRLQSSMARHKRVLGRLAGASPKETDR